jgi:hypothetical protein
VSGLLSALGGGGGLAAVQLAAGGLSGILAMVALIATDVVPLRGKPAGAPAALTIRGCFNTGSIVAVAQPGEQMLITGRSADGEFLRVYVPGPVPAGHEGWIPARSVDLLSNGAALPVAGCGEVAAATSEPGPTSTATALVTPGPTPTATGTPKPTPKPQQTAGPTAQATAKPTTKPTATPTAAPTPNLGPVFTTQPRSSATKLGIKQFTASFCGVYGTRTQVEGAAQDPDGVASMQLWVQKPKTRSFVRLAHDFAKSGETWFGFIDTAKDGITVAGDLYFRAVAVDSKGATTTSSSGRISIFRCDAEATITGGVNLPFINSAYLLKNCVKFEIPWRYTITDPDGLVSASLKYRITHTGQDPLTGTITLKRPFLSLYWIGHSVNPGANYWHYYGTNSVSWTVTTVDKYQEVSTRSQRATVNFSNADCVD